VVTAVTGEGGSGGALALAVADRVLIAQRATYSVISPEGCSAILWGDAAAANAAARALHLTAGELLRLGVVDGVVTEPADGAGADPLAMIDNVGAALARTLAELCARPVDELLRERREKFREIGAAGYTSARRDQAPAARPAPSATRPLQPTLTAAGKAVV